MGQLLISITTIVVGALATGILAQYFARYWQDRQRELEQRTELVTDITRSMMTVIIEAQELIDPIAQANYASGGDGTQSEQRRRFQDVYKTWLTSNAIIMTALELYFETPRSVADSIPARWELLRDTVSDLCKKAFAVLANGNGEEPLSGSIGEDPSLGRQEWFDLKEEAMREKSLLLQSILRTKIPALTTHILPHRAQ